MGLLLVVMLVLWIRMLSNGPASATAAFIRRSVQSVEAITDNGKLTQAASSSSPVLDWLAQPRRPVERNLFAIHLEYYARANETAPATESPEDPEKSANEAADQDREKQILLGNLQSQAATMKLQTTVMGPVPTALVNGQLVKEGDSIDGFKVVRIDPRRMVIEQAGVTLEIWMP
jgi:hypothetical protein